MESSFSCTFASAGAAAVPLARRCLAWAATAAGLTIARTPAEMPPENRWVCSTQRGVGWLVAAPDGAAMVTIAPTMARANRMTRVRFTDTLLEPKEDRPIAVWGWRRPGAGIAGPARAPSWLAPPIHHPLAPCSIAARPNDILDRATHPEQP